MPPSARLVLPSSLQSAVQRLRRHHLSSGYHFWCTSADHLESHHSDLIPVVQSMFVCVLQCFTWQRGRFLGWGGVGGWRGWSVPEVGETLRGWDHPLVCSDSLLPVSARMRRLRSRSITAPQDPLPPRPTCDPLRTKLLSVCPLQMPLQPPLPAASARLRLRGPLPTPPLQWACGHRLPPRVPATPAWPLQVPPSLSSSPMHASGAEAKR